MIQWLCHQNCSAIERTVQFHSCCWECKNTSQSLYFHCNNFKILLVCMLMSVSKDLKNFKYTHFSIHVLSVYELAKFLSWKIYHKKGTHSLHKICIKSESIWKWFPQRAHSLQPGIRCPPISPTFSCQKLTKFAKENLLKKTHVLWILHQNWPIWVLHTYLFHIFGGFCWTQGAWI